MTNDFMQTRKLKETPAQREMENRCRRCGVPLKTNAERKIGIHISCVQEAEQSRVNIPRPRYGKARI